MDTALPMAFLKPREDDMDETTKLLQALEIPPHQVFAADLRSWHLGTDLTEQLTAFAEQLRDAPSSQPNFAIPSPDEKLFGDKMLNGLLEELKAVVSAPTDMRKRFVAKHVLDRFLPKLFPTILEKTTLGRGSYRFFIPWDGQRLLSAVRQHEIKVSLDNILQLSHLLYWWVSGALPPTLMRLINMISPDLPAEWIHAICNYASHTPFLDPAYEKYHDKLGPSGSTGISNVFRQMSFGEDNIEEERPVLALVALARLVLRAASEYLSQTKGNFGNYAGQLLWRSFCPWIFLDVTEHRNVHVAAHVDMSPKLSIVLVLGRLRRLQLSSSGLTSLPVVLYVLWSLAELDARGNAIAIDAKMCKTTKIWSKYAWHPRILIDVGMLDYVTYITPRSEETNVADNVGHFFMSGHCHCTTYSCSVFKDERAFVAREPYPSKFSGSGQAPWLWHCTETFAVHAADVRCLQELEVDDVSDSEYLEKEYVESSAPTSAEEPISSSEEATSSSGRSVVYPQNAVTYSGMRQLADRGEMRSLGTLDHTSGPGKCFVCRKYLRGVCVADSVCPRCHGPHDESSLPRGGGSRRQRAARLKGALMRVSTPDPFEQN